MRHLVAILLALSTLACTEHLPDIQESAPAWSLIEDQRIGAAGTRPPSRESSMSSSDATAPSWFMTTAG